MRVNYNTFKGVERLSQSSFCINEEAFLLLTMVLSIQGMDLV